MKTVKRESFNKEKNGEWVLTKTWTLCYTPISFDEVDQVSEDIRKILNPNLLSSQYKEGNKTNPLFGHCYHSTQAMYIMLDGDEKENLVPYSGMDVLGNIHWWLDHNGTIIDVTAGQYDLMECDPPYDVGKPTKWYGWRNRLHKRSMGLVQDVQGGKLECVDPDGNIISIRKPLPITLEV
jgi:hypothetical protein